LKSPFRVECAILVGIVLFHAFGADAVADVDAGVLVEVDVDLLPVALVIADFLAEGA